MTNCQKARELMARARQEKFGIGAFNLDNQETLIAVCQAAASLKAPVIVEVSQTEVEALGLLNVRDMVNNYQDQYQIEIYLNLDHGASVSMAAQAIEAGYEFVHIDISQANKEAPDQEIIQATCQVVALAKKTGALVESEPHYFAGASNVFDQPFDENEIKKTYSTPQGAAAFVKATGIDTFAASVGNLHGRYPVPKILDLELLEKIRQAVPPDLNLSLHGGSGTPLEYFVRATKIGVSKININSDLRQTFRQNLERVLRQNPKEFAIVKLMPEVIEALKEVVCQKIKAFGSEGKSRYV